MTVTAGLVRCTSFGIGSSVGMTVDEVRVDEVSVVTVGMMVGSNVGWVDWESVVGSIVGEAVGYIVPVGWWSSNGNGSG